MEGSKGQNLQSRLEFSEGVLGDSNQKHFVRGNGYFLEPHINFREKVTSKLQVLLKKLTTSGVAEVFFFL